MLCRNCNNKLSGEEDFCPHCGVPQKLTDILSSSDKNAPEVKNQNQDSPIFQTEPVCIYTDPPKESKRSKAPFIFISVFIITLLIIGPLQLRNIFSLLPLFQIYFRLKNPPHLIPII